MAGYAGSACAVRASVGDVSSASRRVPSLNRRAKSRVEVAPGAVWGNERRLGSRLVARLS